MGWEEEEVGGGEVGGEVGGGGGRRWREEVEGGGGGRRWREEVEGGERKTKTLLQQPTCSQCIPQYHFHCKHYSRFYAYSTTYRLFSLKFTSKLCHFLYIVF